MGNGDRTSGFLFLSDEGWLGSAEAKEGGTEAHLLQPPYNVHKAMTLVHKQLVVLRSAMLLAALLRRQLILPRIACGYDRWWAEHNGTVPFASMALPIMDCPTDHVLDLNRLAPYEQWLPRERTFLGHPEMPSSVHESAANVSLGHSARWRAKAAEASAGRFGERGATEVATGGSSGPAELVALLAHLESHATDWPTERARSPQSPWANAAHAPGSQPAMLLGLSDVPDIFRMLPPADQARFMRHAQEFVGIMCCTWSPKSNGYVNYDLFHDIVPRTDQKGRSWTTVWAPLFAGSTQRLSDCELNLTDARKLQPSDFGLLSAVLRSAPSIRCGYDPRPI